MAKKEFIIFGLGKFGKSVAETFAKSGCEVLVVDKNDDVIQEMADVVTHAVKADVTDIDVMRGLGIRNFDVAVVAIADHLEASIMATIIAKEAGIPFVLAKAQNEIHATVLQKVGADEIIFPEKAMGVRVARNLMEANYVDIADLSNEISIAEIPVPSEWIGKTLRELNVRDKYGFNLIAMKRDEKVTVNLLPDQVFEKGEKVVVIAENTAISKILK